MRSKSLSEAQKEAQSAAEVAAREEQNARNKENMAQVAAKEDARRLESISRARPRGHPV